MGCGKSKDQNKSSSLGNSGSNRSITGTSSNITVSLKVALSGEMGVGKTSIIHRFIENKFSEETEPTVNYDNESIHKEITVDGKNVKLAIFDSLGQERDRTITRPNYPKPLAAMIMVFDVRKKETAKIISPWIQEIRNLTSQDVLVVLVANKTDCSPEEREVPTSEGERIAKENNALYIETSAKTGQNIERLFQLIATEVTTKQRKA